MRDFFAWLETRGVTNLDFIEPITVSAYIESLAGRRSRPTVKQHLAAIKGLFDWLVVGQVLPSNPATSVRGPAYSVTRGKTPALSAEQTRALLDSIDRSTVAGLRDRALIGLMVFTFARVSAATGMQVQDYRQDGTGWRVRLFEKGGKVNEVPAPSTLQAYLGEYLSASGLAGQPSAPLFPTIDRRGRLTRRALSRNEALKMVKRRALKAGIPSSTCNHSFRATGITVFLGNGGKMERAQRIAGHSSLKTTQLYDRTDDGTSRDEMELVKI